MCSREVGLFDRQPAQRCYYMVRRMVWLEEWRSAGRGGRRRNSALQHRGSGTRLATKPLRSQIAVLVLSTNNWIVIRQHIAEIASAADTACPGSFSFLQIGQACG